MPWLRSGTVSCTQNSTTVTGTNAGFAANARVGDAFLGPDGRWYEVANVASDTVLSILPAYQGATVSAGAYALAPMQGYVKDSADALRTLVNKFGSLANAPSITALAALVGAADKIAYFTAADAMASADFTAQARTFVAAKTVAAQRTVLGLGSAAVAATLGTVSQSSGVPTGAIIETGSNSNGRYTKFADGTMICSLLLGPINIAAGSIYNSGIITFPAAFASEVRCHLNFSGSYPYDLTGNFESGVSTTSCKYSVVNRNASQTLSPYVYITATGRWF